MLLFDPQPPLRNIHTRNPYKPRAKKRHPADEEEPRTLDGYFALTNSGCELPEEVIKLDLRDRNFHSINLAEMDYFKNLHEIIASGNRLRISDFSIFLNLKVLSLSDNRISSIEELRNFPKIEVLDLSINMIKDISPLFRLRTLTSLDVSSNLLTGIPAEIESLDQLSTLSLCYNQISEESCTELWPNLAKLPRLSKLMLAGNQISIITESKQVMRHFRLSKLDLSSNLLSEEFDVLSLVDCSKLENLVLSENPFKSSIDNFVKLISNTLRTKVSLSYQPVKMEPLKTIYKQFKLMKVKEVLYDVTSQRDLVGILIDAKKAPPKPESAKESPKKGMFLTGINHQKVVSLKPLKNSAGDFHYVTNKELMRQAAHLLKSHKPKKRMPLNLAYASLQTMPL